jgi:hypothetical protein
LPVWRNRNRRKTDFVILLLQRLRSASENACARLPPPNRNQIGVNIMSSSNLDHTGPRRQTLLDNPKLLGNRPPPSPLRAGQNRNRRQRLLICLQINEQTISRSNTIQEGGPHRGLTSNPKTAPKKLTSNPSIQPIVMPR